MQVCVWILRLTTAPGDTLHVKYQSQEERLRTIYSGWDFCW